MARGAALDVTLEITCNASRTAFVQVSVSQRVGSGVASGTAFEEVACTGAGQLVVIRVPVSGAGKAFRQGTAVVTATISGCRSGVCGSESDSEVVEVVR